MNRLVARILTSFLAAAPLSVAASAQEPTPTPTPDVSALRARISRLPSAAINVQILPDGTVVASTPAPTSSPAPGATPVPPGPAPAGPPLRTMQFRDLRYVPLEAREEAEAQAAVVAQVQRQAPGSISFLDGAFQALSAENTQLTLKAIALGGPPLRYNQALQRFEGTIRVGVMDIGGRRAPQLSEEILLQVIGVDASPETVSLKSTAPPFQSVAIASASAESTVDLQVFSPLSNEGVKLTLPLQPALFVDISPRNIEGWGLEKAVVRVSTRGLAAGSRRPVQLKWSQGVVEPGSLELDENGVATAAIHSTSTGESTVTAYGAGFSADDDKVTFDFPTNSLLAVLLGGLVGGALRAGAPSRSAWPRYFLKVGAGILVGAVVFALFALGINVTGFPIPAQAGEVVVFTVVALGAFGGTRLLVKPA